MPHAETLIVATPDIDIKIASDSRRAETRRGDDSSLYLDHTVDLLMLGVYSVDRVPFAINPRINVRLRRERHIHSNAGSPSSNVE